MGGNSSENLSYWLITIGVIDLHLHHGAEKYTKSHQCHSQHDGIRGKNLKSPSKTNRVRRSKLTLIRCTVSSINECCLQIRGCQSFVAAILKTEKGREWAETAART